MAAACNGMALHEGFIPSGASFLVFTDYCRPSLRLAALMGLRVAHVFTHNSIGLGEDGPTHQPVEHLAALRAIPNLLVFRPADSVETVECWQAALAARRSPSILVVDAAESAGAAAQPCFGESVRARRLRNRAGAGESGGVDLRLGLGSVDRGRRAGAARRKRTWRRASFRFPAWSGSPSRAKTIVAMSWATPGCASASRRRSARAGTR